MNHACGCESAACNRSKMSYSQKDEGSSILKKGATILFVPTPFSSEPMNIREKFNCCMFFHNCKILNPIKLAPSSFTNVNVIETTPDPGVSGTGLLQMSSLTFD